MGKPTSKSSSRQNALLFQKSSSVGCDEPVAGGAARVAGITVGHKGVIVGEGVGVAEGWGVRVGAGVGERVAEGIAVSVGVSLGSGVGVGVHRGGRVGALSKVGVVR